MKKEDFMNNQMPFFIPNMPPNNMKDNNLDIERIINKINRLEKHIRILENRMSKLENSIPNNNNNYFQDDPTDMYII